MSLSQNNILVPTPLFPPPSSDPGSLARRDPHADYLRPFLTGVCSPSTDREKLRQVSNKIFLLVNSDPRHGVACGNSCVTLLKGTQRQRQKKKKDMPARRLFRIRFYDNVGQQVKRERRRGWGGAKYQGQNVLRCTKSQAVVTALREYQADPASPRCHQWETRAAWEEKSQSSLGRG